MRRLTLEEAARALKAGEPVIMPTDTVCGLGLSVLAAESPAELFRLKGRPSGKPVAWLVGGVRALDEYGKDVPPYVRALAERFWPGALTLVVNASEAVPLLFQSDASTIGLRMPASPDVLALIEASGGPLAVTSANRSGDPAPGRIEAVDPALAAAAAGVFSLDSASTPSVPTASTALLSTAPAPPVSTSEDAFPTPAAAVPSASATPTVAPAAVASTVLDCTGDVPRLLREGALSFEELKGALS